ncbi:MAG: amidase [Methylocystis sp.]|nr:amidase [Methylocystis sp.]MCA3583477.1 amidase [Methylocystis sp.]MCA3587099.1 amidase [Methylocystis sp.]MCA3592772.1 amidase [Methylocystis sp.]
MLLKEDPSRGFMPYPSVKVPGARSGPLKGLTFAVKDLFDVAGYPTSAGSPHMLAMSGIKTRNAPIVQKLLDAGAAFVGKTITDELAFSMNGKNAHFGTPVNGGAKDRIPGGSSSGSAAAVSNGLCDFALGSDTGGSVRAPANHCGLYGLRPTHGRVSLKGAHDLSKSFDTCGWFARDAATFARVADVMLGKDKRPLPEKPRLLIAEDCFGLLDDAVRSALAPAIKRLEKLYGPAEPVTAAKGGFEELYWAFRRIQGKEAWDTDGAMIDKYMPPLGPGVAERFAYSKGVRQAEVAAADKVRARLTAELTSLLGKDGVLILPSMADIAPKLSDTEAELQAYRDKSINILCLSGLSRLPQLSMPLAKRLGAPLGLSIMGPAGTDRSLIRIAEAIG